MQFITRPGTSDQNIFRSINEPQFNEYRLPEAFTPQDLVIDIGCHIGSFSYACAAKGAGQIVSFEAWEENYKIAKNNLTLLNNFPVDLHNKAVWRSDLAEMPTLHFKMSTDYVNTGGGNVLFQTQGVEVSTIALDSVLNSTVKNVTLLKLDCEGSEFPILLTSKMLYKVDNICGEYHEMGGKFNPLCGIPPIAQVGDYKEYTIEILVEFLEAQGFTVEHFRHGTSNLGMFFAVRNA